MDKYEYRIRAEEINSLIEQKEYAEAVKIADTIDWRRVRSVVMLCKVSELYKINRRYEDSKEVLLLAYDLQQGSRKIIYSLCELSIKLEETVQAVEYYKEFVQVAPRDTGKFILQYRLYEAQDVSLEERIAVLEEFKKRDYREKWAYELAYLYHRIGLATRCVEECDELILWFGEGKYVLKAMELKMLHAPLTPQQQEKYNARFMSETEAIAMAEEQEQENKEHEDVVPSLPIEIKSIQATNAKTMKIPAKKVQKEAEMNPKNSKEMLANQLDAILKAGKEKTEQVTASMEDVRRNFPISSFEDNTENFTSTRPFERINIFGNTESSKENEVLGNTESSENIEALENAEDGNAEIFENAEYNLNGQTEEVSETADEEDADMKIVKSLNDLDIQIKPIDVNNEYSTINLQEALAKDLAKLFAEEDMGATDATRALPVDTLAAASNLLNQKIEQKNDYPEVNEEVEVFYSDETDEDREVQAPAYSEREIEKDEKEEAPVYSEKETEVMYSNGVEEEENEEVAPSPAVAETEVMNSQEAENDEEVEIPAYPEIATETDEKEETFVYPEIVTEKDEKEEAPVYPEIETEKDEKEEAPAYPEIEIEKDEKEEVPVYSEKETEVMYSDGVEEEENEEEETPSYPEIETESDEKEEAPVYGEIATEKGEKEEAPAYPEIEIEKDEKEEAPVYSEKETEVMYSDGVEEEENEEEALSPPAAETEAIDSQEAENDEEEETPAYPEIETEKDEKEEVSVYSEKETEVMYSDGVEEEENEEEAPSPPAAETEVIYQQEAEVTYPEDGIGDGIEENQKEENNIEESNIEEKELKKELEPLIFSNNAPLPDALIQAMQAVAIEAAKEAAKETASAIQAMRPQVKDENPASQEVVTPQENKPQEKPLEKQITGQLSFTDIMDEWEKTKKANEEKHLEEMKQRALEKTGPIFSNFDSMAMTNSQDDLTMISPMIDVFSETEELAQEVQQALNEEIQGDVSSYTGAAAANAGNSFDERGASAVNGSAGQKAESAYDVNEAARRAAESVYNMNEAAKRAAENVYNTNETARQAAENVYNTNETVRQAAESANGSNIQNEGTVDAQGSDAISSYSGAASASESSDAGNHDSYTSSSRFNTAEINGLEDKLVTALASQHFETSDIQAAILSEQLSASGGSSAEQTDLADPAAEEVRLSGEPRFLTKTEKELFGSIAQTKQLQQSLAASLDSLSMTPIMGNLIVTGEKGVGTLQIAQNVATYLSQEKSTFTGKIETYTPDSLQQMNINAVFNQIGNGALIIDRAGDLGPQTCTALTTALQNMRGRGMIVILSDTKQDIERLQRSFTALYQYFTVSIDITSLDNDGLVNFGKEYAKQHDYSIDAMGVLALYNRIEEKQTVDHAVTVEEVRQIVDEAIQSASKKNMSHFVDIIFAKRYDNEDMIVLREKDFLNEK